MTEETVRVLIVEDDEDDYIYTRHLLSADKGGHYDVRWADRLETAVSYLGSLQLDVVLLDLSLPDSFGWDTFTTVRHRAPDVPVILLTGVQDEELGARAVHAGAQDYLVKGGLSTALLCRSIRYAIERRRAQDALRTAYRDLQGVIGQSKRDLDERSRQLLVETSRRERAERALGDACGVEALCALVEHTSQRFGAALAGIRERAAALMDKRGAAAHAEHGESIAEAAQSALTMNESLACAARAGQRASRIEDANLAAVVQDIAAGTRSGTAAGGVMVRFDPGAGTPNVRTDPRQLSEIVKVLVEGAGPVLPSGGDVWLQLTAVGSRLRGGDPAKRYVTLDVLYGNLTVDVAALDSLLLPLAGDGWWGRGEMPPGLGFMVLRSRVQGWGGDVEIIERTEKGGGLRVYFEVGNTAARDDDLPASALAAGHGILVADDDDEDRSMIGRALEAAGYRVLLTRSACEGIMHLRAKRPVAAVVVDAVMPDRGGRHLLRAARVASPDAGIVVTSGFPRDFVQGLMSDRNWKFVQKPIEASTLVAAVDAVVRGRFAGERQGGR